MLVEYSLCMTFQGIGLSVNCSAFHNQRKTGVEGTLASHFSLALAMFSGGGLGFLGSGPRVASAKICLLLLPAAWPQHNASKAPHCLAIGWHKASKSHHL